MRNLKGFRIAENPNTEISFLRRDEFRKAYAMIIFNIHEIDLNQLLISYNNATEIDKQVIFNNFIQGILVSKKNYNPYFECFKLICLENGENVNSKDEYELNKKLERISEAGITEAEIIEAVENFSKGFATLKNLTEQKEMLQIHLNSLIAK